jgi:hypothetical protein
MLADRTGLTGALSGALARRGWWPGHDRGRVLADLAVMTADGDEAICDIDVLRHQDELFGQVASASTCWRTLDEIGRPQRRPHRCGAGEDPGLGCGCCSAGRRPPGPPADTSAMVCWCWTWDSTIVLAHSDKDGAAPTYKATYGFHPILVTCDNTNELLAR